MPKKTNAYLYDVITHKNHPERGTMFIVALPAEKPRNFSLLFEFIADLETPVINPVILIERGETPKEKKYFLVSMSPLFSTEQINNLVEYINLNQ